MNQTIWPLVEIVVVGDKCTDLTDDLMKEVVCKQVLWHNLDKNWGYGPSKECGGSVAKQKAIELSSGEYIAYLDDDDEFFPDHLERSIAYLEADSNIDLVYGCSHVYRFLNPFRFKLRNIEWEPEKLPVSNFINTSEVVHRRSVLDCMQQPWWRMDEERNDWGFLLRFVNEGKGKVAHLQHVAATQHICLKDTLMFHRQRTTARRRRAISSGESNDFV
jgi:glycosyltransferase involved in cell wall biosynthesis